MRRLISSRERPRIIESRNSNNFTIDHFVDDLLKMPWDLIEGSDDPDEMWTIWTIKFDHSPIWEVSIDKYW